MYMINPEKRQLIISSPNNLNGEVSLLSNNSITLNEFDTLYKNFLPGTIDTYEVELIFLEVEEYDENTQTYTKVLKPFGRRKDNHHWILTFNESDYNFTPNNNIVSE